MINFLRMLLAHNFRAGIWVTSLYIAGLVSPLQAQAIYQEVKIPSEFGFTNDALVEIRDLGAVSLKDRTAVKAAVRAENADREAVYREIAVANGHPEWESEIRQTFAERWIAKARVGWYYQDSKGGWRQN